MSSQRSLKQIGSYQYNEGHCLGEGAYGKVYQGTDIRSSQTVAIKKMDLALFERDTYLRNQIVSEIEILKKFNHPNIVRFIDLITTQRSLYIITEYCKDGDLKELLARKRLTEKESQQIMLQIVMGFKELVKHGVIHRDLKPANILNHEGVVKIADFGFAKYVDNYTSQLLRSCVGSPLYMAPQILQRKTYSTKCDVWSIGVIFYEMIFFDVPWKGRDEQDLLKNILMKPLVFKSGFQITEFTREFLTKTLTVDETERYSWDKVFSLFEKQENQLVNQSPTLQKLYQEQSWMAKQSQDKVDKDFINQQLVILNQLRLALGFRHFVNVEFHLKYDQFKVLKNKDNLVEECIFGLSKVVVNIAQKFIQNITDICDQGEEYLIKGTKWNIINNFKKEQEYYQILYDQCKEMYNEQEVELSEQEFVKYEETLQQKILKLVSDIIEENRSLKKQEFFDCLVVLDYLVDSVQIIRNYTKFQEQDYHNLQYEKSQTLDYKLVIDRIQNKLKK